MGALQQEPTRGIDADLLHEIVDRHELPGALAHLHLLAALDERHELHDQQLQAVRIATEASNAARIRPM